MTLSFDLVRDPWIPCLDLDGRSKELSLQSALAGAHELRAVEAASPLESASIYRLLLAVLHRVFDNGSPQEWQKLWAAGHWDGAALQRYWEQWGQRFDLFDADRPFYQAADGRVEPRSVVFLIPGMSAAEHYNHAVSTGNVALSPAEAARALLVSQSFGLPGICHPQKKLFFSSAPWLIGMVFFVEGDTLFQTLALNLLRYGPGYPMQELDKSPGDAPAWEMADPFQDEREVPVGYLDYLTWHNRRIRLLPERTRDGVVVRKATMTPGLRLSEAVRDPMKHYRRDDRLGLRALRLNENRSLWRDSSVLLSVHGASGAQPPAAVSWMSTLSRALGPDDGSWRSRRYRLTGIGIISDQAKALMCRAERMPLPLKYIEEEPLLAALDLALKSAEDTRAALWGGLHQVALLLLSNQADNESGHKPQPQDVKQMLAHWDAERLYWTALETPFWQLMEDLLKRPAPQALDDWHRVLRDTAYQAFEQAQRMVGSGAEELKALVQGRRMLAASLRKKGILPSGTQS